MAIFGFALPPLPFNTWPTRNPKALFFPAQIRAGNAYVNVHTRDLTLPATQLQPGNYPGGEVRGQIDHGNGMH